MKWGLVALVALVLTILFNVPLIVWSVGKFFSLPLMYWEWLEKKLDMPKRK